MNGAQDMGGQHGFGPVKPEPNEPPFHAPWEQRAFALTVAMGGTGEWNIDQSRYARESLPPAEYLAKSYYEIWFAGLERMLLQRGFVAPEEIEVGKAHRASQAGEADAEGRGRRQDARPRRAGLAAGAAAGALRGRVTACARRTCIQ